MNDPVHKPAPRGYPSTAKNLGEQDWCLECCRGHKLQAPPPQTPFEALVGIIDSLPFNA